MAESCAIVIDIGKSLSKVSLWSPAGTLLDRQSRPNPLCSENGIARLDTAGIESWLVEALRRYRDTPVKYIVPVAHAAGVAVLGPDGLAFPPLDYEQEIPAEAVASYRPQRDAFAATGSPALPNGLNLGCQLHWLEQLYPAAMARGTLLPWAQYWAWVLTGRAVSEVTSLGCHSDLWIPTEANYSCLAQRRGWARRFAPLVRADAIVGTLRPALATAAGLPEDVQVLAGLHDSNASLLAARGFTELQAAPQASLLSTGTWFVGMQLGSPDNAPKTLDEARDCLINVDVFGQPVPSARFMGGREIELVTSGMAQRPEFTGDQSGLLASVPRAVENRSFLLPAWAQGCGPFPAAQARWINPPATDELCAAAICLYAALMADTLLDLIGADGPLLLEGRFAAAEVFVRALASLRLETKVYRAEAETDVSFGALRLVNPALTPSAAMATVAPLPQNLHDYRTIWRTRIEECA